nr:YkgJ family cysteine cluster protein [Listeria monocytogenes]
MGRNDMCFCGSGIKKKKCHSNYQEGTPIASIIKTYCDFDEYAKKIGITNNCPINCQECCKDIFSVGENEFYTILDYILYQKKEDIKLYFDRAKIIQDIIKKNYPDVYKKMDNVMPVGKGLDHLEPYLKNNIYDTTLPSCVFLNEDGQCGVYDVRPSVCRMYGSCVLCEKINNEQIMDEKLAIIATTEETIIEKRDTIVVKRPYPIFYWLCLMNESKQYYSFFMDKLNRFRLNSVRTYGDYTIKNNNL